MSAERHHLLDKAIRKNSNPIEIAICSIASTLAFAWVNYIWASEIRYDMWYVALIMGPLLVASLAAGFTVNAIKKKTNFFINMSVCMWAAAIVGFLTADQLYWKYITNFFTYEGMLNYVNVDPAEESGQTFMDAGRVYFKENTLVVSKQASAFHNGDTYCVAPIIRQASKSAEDANTESPLSVPAVGTFDFWAVGLNCCGKNAEVFHCPEVDNPKARSGMRLLDDTQRQYFLLAVQQWSATAGLPVRHPLFFTWVQDPLAVQEGFMHSRWKNFWEELFYFFLGAVVVSFLLHLVLKRNRVY